ncbi:MAG TPA: porin [Sphingomicrobium sp.]|nr:porin [Sphingomicrobium sp.]
MNKAITRALLGGGALFWATAAIAQDPAPQPAESDQPDQSDATADAAIAEAAPADDAAAKIELLQAQVEALQEALEQVKASVVKATPSWKGAPEFADKDTGFTFKPKGFMQFDAGYVGFPDGDQLRGTQAGINYQNLGWNTRARRLVFGAEGGLPGGFKYKAEFNFAQGTVDYEDILLSYDFAKVPLTVTVGNFYPYSSLETMTSSRLGSMLERASFTDAFNDNRRLGIGLSLADKKADRYTFSAGIFSREINDTSFIRTGWEFAARGTYTPPVAGGFVHLGASVHHRVNNQEALAQQYRSRPLTQVTDQRFVDTGNIASRGDNSVGLELGGVFKSFHFAAEAQKLWVNHAFSPTDVLNDPESNDTIPGGAVKLNGDPSFEGGYFELGYYFTGESRGYKGGKWDRTKVLHPFDKGGWGAIQLNGRIDYLNLNDSVGNAGANLTVANPNYVNGGKQIGYQASVIWNPMDYLRFMAQYGHVDVTGGPHAISPLFSPADTTPINKRDYNVDTAAVRAQLEF